MFDSGWSGTGGNSVERELQSATYRWFQQIFHRESVHTSAEEIIYCLQRCCKLFILNKKAVVKFGPAVLYTKVWNHFAIHAHKIYGLVLGI